MNMFILSKNIDKIAEYHNDSHVVKMVLETAQLLSSAHRYWDKDDLISPIIYKEFEPNHPVTKWVRETNNNYNWTYSLFIALAKEYTYRFNKIHGSYKKLHEVLVQPPKNIPIGYKTEPYLCVPDDCRLPNVVDSYRKYYIEHKKHIAKWSKRDIPEWYNNKDHIS